MEGYFVRTLGMHRVYNSAFMHMLRDENNAGYRTVIRETLEFDPEILKRYVNFMNNPDEKTAVDQFGKGDKYFGVATRHGDAARAADVRPRPGRGVRREVRHGVPARDARRAAGPRGSSSGTSARSSRCSTGERGSPRRTSFLLYDFVHGRRRGRRGRPRLLERHRPDTIARGLPQPVRVDGRHRSASPSPTRASPPAARSGSSAGRSPRGSALPDDPAMFVTFRDARTGLEYLRSCRELRERGLWLTLEAYQGHVFWEFRELGDGAAGQWQRLADRLGGRGVPSLDDALRELQLEPVHAPLRALFEDGHVAAVLDGSATAGDLDALEDRLATLLAAVAERDRGRPAIPSATATSVRERSVGRPIADGRRATCRGTIGRRSSAGSRCRGWASSRQRPTSRPRAAPGTTSCGWRRCVAARLPRPPASTRPRPGPSPISSACCWPCRVRRRSAAAAGSGTSRLLERWLARDAVRAAMGVNTWEGVEWLDRDRFTRPARLGRCGSMRSRPGASEDTALVARLAAAAEAAGYRVDALSSALTAAGSHPPPILVMPHRHHSNRSRRRSEVGGAPWAMTASRWSR